MLLSLAILHPPTSNRMETDSTQDNAIPSCDEANIDVVLAILKIMFSYWADHLYLTHLSLIFVKKNNSYHIYTELVSRTTLNVVKPCTCIK